MQVMFAFPDNYGNSGNEMFRGQNQGFSHNQQNQTQGNGGGGQGGSLNQGGNLGHHGSSLGNNGSSEQPKRRGRGFASMDPQRVSEIASMGGKAAHQQGVAHEWTPDEARRAGRKGGQASRGNSGAGTNSESAGGGSF